MGTGLQLIGYTSSGRHCQLFNLHCPIREKDRVWLSSSISKNRELVTLVFQINMSSWDVSFKKMHCFYKVLNWPSEMYLLRGSSHAPLSLLVSSYCVSPLQQRPWPSCRESWSQSCVLWQTEANARLVFHLIEAFTISKTQFLHELKET